MMSLAIAIFVGFALGLLIGWAVGKKQIKQNEGASLGSVVGAVGSIAALF